MKAVEKHVRVVDGVQVRFPRSRGRQGVLGCSVKVDLLFQFVVLLFCKMKRANLILEWMTDFLLSLVGPNHDGQWLIAYSWRAT